MWLQSVIAGVACVGGFSRRLRVDDGCRVGKPTSDLEVVRGCHKGGCMTLPGNASLVHESLLAHLRHSFVDFLCLDLSSLR
jgi:hypothetical protein